MLLMYKKQEHTNIMVLQKKITFNIGRGRTKVEDVYKHTPTPTELHIVDEKSDENNDGIPDLAVKVYTRQ